jgi:hypothetical protein
VLVVCYVRSEMRCGRLFGFVHSSAIVTATADADADAKN